LWLEKAAEQGEAMIMAADVAGSKKMTVEGGIFELENANADDNANNESSMKVFSLSSLHAMLSLCESIGKKAAVVDL
jgi:hypothetical protein